MQQENSLQHRLKKIIQFLPGFYANPIEKIKYAIRRDWLDILLIQVLVSLVSGILTGLVEQSLIFLFWGIFFFPILAVILSFVFALVVHYSIIIFFEIQPSLRRTYHLVVLANLPFLLIRVASPILASVDILGFVLTTFLLSVGLIEDYRLDKQKVIKLMAALCAIVIMTWLIRLGINWYINPEFNLPVQE